MSVAVSRVEAVDNSFVQGVEAAEEADLSAGRLRAEDPIGPRTRLTASRAVALFEAQVASRHLDFEARRLKGKGRSFYTIGSSGHEGNVVVGDLLRLDDPVFLHYRSGALFLRRAWRGAAHGIPSTPLWDVLLGLVASSEDPISGGRHKVFGSRPLWIPPQTSTIASHLPKSMGAAFAIERGRHLGLELKVPEDAIVGCSFGDASLGHGVAQGALGACEWASRQNLPLPILFVCEDNGLGISVRTPRGWIEGNVRRRHGFTYLQADGTSLVESYDVVSRAIEICRENRRPVFCHLKTVRLLAHAGSDVELEYRDREEIEADEARDPVLATAVLLLQRGVLSKSEILDLYESMRTRIRALSDEVVTRPRLQTAKEVMDPIAPQRTEKVERELHRTRALLESGGGEEKPRHMAVAINRVLAEHMELYPEMLLFGEDVARKGGVYHLTTGLQKRFGSGRVFNTLLDETSILGLAIGCAHLGFLPVPEIQYLAYYHNAQDQIRGEAASLSFFSRHQFTNPMVVRVASFAYQKGFGGHFHNDNSIAALTDVPGLILAVPARGEDAVGMMRTLLATARSQGRVGMFLEPIALYMKKDLHEERDGGWLDRYPEPEVAVPLGEPRLYREGRGEDLSIVTYGNGVWMGLRVARKLAEEGVGVRLLDLRWLAPLPVRAIIQEAERTGRVLVVDECRRTGGPGERIACLLLEGLSSQAFRFARVTGEDSYIPLGPAAHAVLPSEAEIDQAARVLLEEGV